MRYYVLGEDGNRYGPADDALLIAWAREGRITPHSYLEPEGGGVRVLASTMAQLQFPPVRTPYTGAPQGGPYYGQAPSFGSIGGFPQTYAQPTWSAWEVRSAWMLTGFGAAAEVLCFGSGLGVPFAILGIAIAVFGLFRGRKAGGPLALGLFVIALNIFLGKIGGQIGQ